jgi:hypothetical protein
MRSYIPCIPRQALLKFEDSSVWPQKIYVTLRCLFLFSSLERVTANGQIDIHERSNLRVLLFVSDNIPYQNQEEINPRKWRDLTAMRIVPSFGPAA